MVFRGLCVWLHATSDPETSGRKGKIAEVGMEPIHLFLFSSNWRKKQEEIAQSAETAYFSGAGSFCTSLWAFAWAFITSFWIDGIRSAM